MRGAGFFAGVCLMLGAFSAPVAAQDVTIPAPEGYFAPGRNPYADVLFQPPAQVAVSSNGCTFQSPFGAARVDWAGPCEGGRAVITVYDAGGLIERELTLGPEAELMLREGLIVWNDAQPYGVGFVQPMRNGRQTIGGLFAQVGADFNLQNPDALAYLAAAGRDVFEAYRERIPQIKGKKIDSVVVVVRRRGESDGSGIAQIFMNPDGTITKISSSALDSQTNRIKQRNREIRTAMAASDQTRLREERAAYIASTTETWTREVAAQVESGTVSVQIADILRHARVQAMTRLVGGLTVQVPFNAPDFANGKVVLAWREAARDIEREAFEMYRQRIRDTWDDLFRMTQKSPFASVYDIRCEMDPAAMAGLEPGRTYPMTATLVALRDNSVWLACVPAPQ